MIADPALRFWLRYADREGAVYEEGDPALVLLPGTLRAASGLPEEVAVTAAPDVARDDGALLLISGHPLVDSAVAAVLEEGDTGWVQLAWPASQPPATAALEARAREWFMIDHGRIDAAGEAASVYVPVLRIGALVNYEVSLDRRFREREEVWVDARTGFVIDDGLRQTIQSWPRAAAPDRSRPCLVPDFDRALAQADACLHTRADARLRALAAQAEGDRRDQLRRTEAYFDATLASIAQRREAAAPERHPMLDAQAEATRQERVRRLAEIDETYRATSTLTPFRAHLLLVPALFLPVRVRRGHRSFALSFTWVLPAATFAPCPCPCCGAREPLVAGRERLGCRSCLPAAPLAGPVPVAVPAPAAGAAASPPTTASRSSAPAVPATNGQATPAQPRPRPRASARSKRVTPRAVLTGEEHLCRVGDKLAADFWRIVGDLERWPRRSVEPSSPLAALYRLYGPLGPAFALGASDEYLPHCIASATTASDAELPVATAGLVSAGGLPYPFTLRWRLEGGKPLVAEVIPLAAAQATTLPPDSRLGRWAMRRLFADAPPPPVPLDPVAAALWNDHVAIAGLPVILRALAAWWRAEPHLGPPEATDAGATAAALLSLVGPRAGRRHLAALGQPSDIAAVAQRLQAILRLSRVRPW